MYFYKYVNKGFTFAETMISLALVLVAFGLLFSISWSGIRLGAREEAAQKMNQSATLLFASLKKDLRSCSEVKPTAAGARIKMKRAEGGSVVETAVSYEITGLKVLRISGRERKEYDLSPGPGAGGRLELVIAPDGLKACRISLKVVSEGGTLLENSEIVVLN